jgi:hypothetical protein
LEIEIQDRYATHSMWLSRRAIEPEYCEIMRHKFLTISNKVPFCMLAWDFTEDKDRINGKYRWGFEHFKSKKGDFGYWDMGEYLKKHGL